MIVLPVATSLSISRDEGEEGKREVDRQGKTDVRVSAGGRGVASFPTPRTKRRGLPGAAALPSKASPWDSALTRPHPYCSWCSPPTSARQVRHPKTSTKVPKAAHVVFIDSLQNSNNKRIIYKLHLLHLWSLASEEHLRAFSSHAILHSWYFRSCQVLISEGAGRFLRDLHNFVALLRKSSASEFLKGGRERRSAKCFPRGCSVESSESEEVPEVESDYVRSHFTFLFLYVWFQQRRAFIAITILITMHACILFGQSRCKALNVVWHYIRAFEQCNIKP